MMEFMMIVFLASGIGAGMEVAPEELLAGQDLHLHAKTAWTCQKTETPNEHILLFEDGFSMTIGDNAVSCQNAVLWLNEYGQDIPGLMTQSYYRAQLYLETKVNIKQGKKGRTTQLDRLILDGGDNLIIHFIVSGQILVSVEKQMDIACLDLQGKPLFQRANQSASSIPQGPQVPAGALVPQVQVTPEFALQQAGQPEVISQSEAQQSSVLTQEVVPPIENKRVYAYPVHISAVWDPEPVVERMKLEDGRSAITVSGRFYIWQRQSPNSLLEFQADSAVLFYQPEQFNILENRTGRDLAEGRLDAVYLRGNIVMTQANRTVRADEVFYNFIKKQAVIVNGSMRMFDENRGLPVYLSAQKLCQVSEKIYQADKVTLTSSEFYLPQLSANAARMVLIDEKDLDKIDRQNQRDARTQSARQDDSAGTMTGTMEKVQMKYYTFPFFTWPKMKTNFVRPDTPLRKLVVGSDSEYGTTVETRWQLYRLLGMKQPVGTDASFAADYYSDRGVGTGMDMIYNNPESYGNVVGYVMTDRGKDDLGRTRKDIDPQEDIRGRLGIRHKQYLPNDWQATMEVGYVSDRNFLEWMYRDEFNTDKGQETLLYLKKQRDNWAFSILGKVRINDFETMEEELPTVEYHVKGQSFWDHQLTWYSDSRASRLKDRYDEATVNPPSEDFYSLGYTRNEADWPVMLGTVKVTPFVAGTYAYEDQNGYNLAMNNTTAGNNYSAVLGETGVRASTMFWKEDTSIQSRLWDIDGIRHVVTPHLEAVTYQENEDGIEMRDMFNLGLSQRWQTHRGQGAGRYSTDLLRMNINSTWVNNEGPDDIDPAGQYGPAGFIYNDPSIPLFLRRNNPSFASKRYYGIVRDSINGDAEWRISEVLSALGDMNYDVASGKIQQVDVGLSRYVFPDLSLYLGSRYLRPINIPVDTNNDGTVEYTEQGSHSVVGAITYQLSPRYWVTYMQEYNLEFGSSVRTDFAIVRQYHRMFYALQISIDESLDRNSAMFSIWPEGVKELALGSRRYTGLTGAKTEQ